MFVVRSLLLPMMLANWIKVVAVAVAVEEMVVLVALATDIQ